MPFSRASPKERMVLPMHWKTFPPRMRQLERFVGLFEASRIRADGCDILLGTYPARTTIEPHQHDTDNYGVITRGEMFITIGDVERRYGPGEWYHVPANVVHSARCSADTEEIDFWFAVD
jgi:quercetin dioxygenase-like cupin family protein